MYEIQREITVTTTRPWRLHVKPSDAEDLPLLHMADLEGPAGKASIDTLRDVWRARWGDVWVKRSEIDDEFYTVTAQRLVATGWLEVHELADGTRVYRLLEK